MCVECSYGVPVYIELRSGGIRMHFELNVCETTCAIAFGAASARACVRGVQVVGRPGCDGRGSVEKRRASTEDAKSAGVAVEKQKQMLLRMAMCTKPTTMITERITAGQAGASHALCSRTECRVFCHVKILTLLNPIDHYRYRVVCPSPSPTARHAFFTVFAFCAVFCLLFCATFLERTGFFFGALLRKATFFMAVVVFMGSTAGAALRPRSKSTRARENGSQQQTTKKTKKKQNKNKKNIKQNLKKKHKTT